MNIASGLLGILKNRQTASVAVDSSELIVIQRQMLTKKKVLRKVFEDMYNVLLKKEKELLPAFGNRVEIGAGASILKSLDSNFLISDIKSAPYLDLVVDATKMPFEDESVRTIICVNCFHHFPDPAQFFTECVRVLAKGGGVMLVEPYESLLGKFLYPRLFPSESFDQQQVGWKQYTRGPMDGANQALSYVVLIRDREQFQKMFPSLEIIERTIVPNYLRYLASGGFNFTSLLPAFAFPILASIEKHFGFLKPIFGLHSIFVIRKRQ